jgi:N-acetylglucosaminyldiphosphoundecaprenol N-acetyl-beta-D-mannosaminyltransferase
MPSLSTAVASISGRKEADEGASMAAPEIAETAGDYMIGAMLPKANLLGVGVTAASPDQIVDHVRSLIAAGGAASTVAAVNVHTFMEARRSPAYGRALNDASVAWVDGVPIRWMLRAAGLPAPERVHGADLTVRLLEGLPSAKHLFFGSTPETLKALEQALARRYPDLRTAGFISPPFRKAAVREDDETLARINRSGADVLWIALGAPKQEMWAALNRDAVRVPVILCVGAAFEILAGRFQRAPRALQRLGLEWLWRLRQDPARLWRRYFATNGAFLSLLAAQSGRRLFRRSTPSLEA